MGRRRSSANKPRTLIAIVQDCSGSMSNRHHATIDGFNEYLDTLREESMGRVYITLTQFNNTPRTVYSAKPLEEIRAMQSHQYTTSGATALYDAVGRTIRDLEFKARLKDRVTMVIMTDGQENWSKEFDHYSITNLLNAKRRDGWEFVFFGAGQNAWQAGANLGFNWNDSIYYGDSDVHHRSAFQELGHLHGAYTSGVSTSNYLSASLTKANLEGQAGSYTQPSFTGGLNTGGLNQIVTTNVTVPDATGNLWVPGDQSDHKVENVFDDGHKSTC